MEGAHAAGLGLMRNLECVPLDARGLAFVRGRLHWQNVLCKALDELVAGCPGQVVTVAPPGYSRERLHAFDQGGLLPENLDTSRIVSLGLGRGAIASVVDLADEEYVRIRALLADEQLSCIVNDPLPTRGEAALEGYDAAFYVGDEAYHLLTARTPEAVAKMALTASPSWDRVSAIVDVPLVVNSGGDVSAERLRAAALTAREISCGAYDGEGYVFWRRVAASG